MPNRSSYVNVAVVGPSGTGKSYMAKTADRLTTGYINMERKPFPYKSEPFKYEGRPKTWAAFMKCLKDYIANPDIKYIIIDSQTMAFNTLNAEMNKNFSNWDIPRNYNSQVQEYLDIIRGVEKDMLIFSHDEFLKISDSGKKKRMFVHNKDFEGKIEEYYTVVLYTGTRLKDGKPQYFLRTFEEDTSTKCSEGLFSKDGKGDTPLEIPNDAKFVFDELERYYSI
jgi:hypothetical protein